MRFFTKAPKHPPQAPVDEWEYPEIKEWLKFLGYPKLKKGFRPVQGKRLAQLSKDDFKQLTSCSDLQARLLADSIQQLLERDEVTLIDTESLEVIHENSPLENKGGVESPLPKSQPLAPALPEEEMGLEEASRILMKWCQGKPLEMVDSLGNCGAGLVKANTTSPMVERLFCVVSELSNSSLHVMVNKHNADLMASSGKMVLAMIGSLARQNTFYDDDHLAELVGCFVQALDLVESFRAPGWFFRMAFSDGGHAEFSRIHQNIISLVTLEDGILPALPPSIPFRNRTWIQQAAYMDDSRPLHRMLKQLGEGDLSQGIRSLTVEEAALEQVSQLLNIHEKVIMKDLSWPSLMCLDLEMLARFLIDQKVTLQDEGRTRRIFHWYDKNESDVLEIDEVMVALRDLGLLDNMSKSDIDQYIRTHFSLHTSNGGDGSVSFVEFWKYYTTLVTEKTKQSIRAKIGPAAEGGLLRQYQSCCMYGHHHGQAVFGMEMNPFQKLVKHSHLKGVTTNEVDLIFTKVKAKHLRRIDFDQFLAALLMISERKDIPIETVVEAIVASEGPGPSTPKSARGHHDDKASGDAASVATVDSADGRKENVPKAAQKSHQISVQSSSSATPNRPLSPRVAEPQSPQPNKRKLKPDDHALVEAFTRYASRGMSAAKSRNAEKQQKDVEMDNASFVRMCKATGLEDGLSGTLDVVFSQVRQQKERKIKLPEFKRALQMLAKAKGMEFEQVTEKIIQGNAPSPLTSTQH
ncbi:hypothetical protein BSKO_02147 [Bryopsis sp. KO-2023]|nr:hypothetical protein BSKO_02147 [Bryopsis sp. KO-2023]